MTWYAQRSSIQRDDRTVPGNDGNRHRSRGPRWVAGLLALCVYFAVGPAQGQLLDRLTNPVIPVDIEHPPGLSLQIDRIVFGPATGECSDQIVSALITDFVSEGVDVIDRASFDLVLAEQEFAFSGRVDPAMALELGRILGPSAMLVVRVQRCATEQSRTYRTVSRFSDGVKYKVRIHQSHTRAHVKLSVQTIDLTTGRIFAAKSIDESPVITYESEEGPPAFASEFDALDRAFGRVNQAVHRMFFPWTEKTDLVYFNDKACGLKEAFQALKSGMTDLAYDRSMANLTTCEGLTKVKPKVLAHAYYNAGMSHMIRHEHDLALEAFYEAARLRPGTVVSDAIEDARRAQESAAAMQEMEEQTAVTLAERDSAERQAAAAQTAATLTNADVIQMVEQKIPAAIILKKISTSACRFDTSPEALGQLSQAGVDEDIVIAMMEFE